MKPWQHLFSILLIPTLVGSLIMEGAIADTQRCGRPGRNGIEGRPGRKGASASEQSIRASNPFQTITLTGTDGENGENGSPGEDASDCEQPRNVEYDLIGAPGGEGGTGGTGGNGGNGGNAILYYTQPQHLRNVLLKNNGGRGGIGGLGGQGSRGCNCTQPTWSVNYCTWALMSRPLESSNTSWKEVRRKTFQCSGDAYFDEQQSRPPRMSSDRNHHYGWKYLGLSRRSRYECVDGRSGSPGKNGQAGEPGAYGRVWLVPGESIPKEQVRYTDSVSSLVGKTIELVKNNWLTKTGLADLLASGSEVPNTYSLLETVRGNFSVAWQAKSSPADLGNPSITATITDSGKIALEVPGTLESKTSMQKNKTLVTITGGIHRDRLQRFKFRGFNRFKDARNFALLDEGRLLNELKATQIEIRLYTQASSTPRTITYQINPQAKPPQGMEIWDNLYKFNLGETFDPWLQSGEAVRYDIQIVQLTKSGASYPSNINIRFVVDKVTPSPNVEY